MATHEDQLPVEDVAKPELVVFIETEANDYLVGGLDQPIGAEFGHDDFSLWLLENIVPSSDQIVRAWRRTSTEDGQHQSHQQKANEDLAQLLISLADWRPALQESTVARHGAVPD
jgi:hypothetical protein